MEFTLVNHLIDHFTLDLLSTSQTTYSNLTGWNFFSTGYDETSPKWSNLGFICIWERLGSQYIFIDLFSFIIVITQGLFNCFFIWVNMCHKFHWKNLFCSH
jgi:hypothetical protein